MQVPLCPCRVGVGTNGATWDIDAWVAQTHGTADNLIADSEVTKKIEWKAFVQEHLHAREITVLVAGFHRVIVQVDEHGPPQLNNRDHHVRQSNLASLQPQPPRTPLVTGKIDFSHKRCRPLRERCLRFCGVEKRASISARFS
jgi:hypothetical protein